MTKLESPEQRRDAGTPQIGRWGRQDSNLRRQSQRVYSPSPLTTRTLPRVDRRRILDGRRSGGGRGAEALDHQRVEGVDGLQGTEEDGELGDVAVGVELEKVDALDLQGAVADVGLEAQGDGVLAVQLVGVAEVFEHLDHVGEHEHRRVAALEALEED